jgi:hypothetical protein
VQPLGCPFFSIGCDINCNTGFVCRNCFDAQVNDYSNLNESLVKLIKKSDKFRNENVKLKKEISN